MLKTQFQLFQVQSFVTVLAVFCSLVLTEQGNRASVLGCNSARWVCWYKSRFTRWDYAFSGVVNSTWFQWLRWKSALWD